MLKIKLTTAFPEWPIIRQTPQSNGIWNNCHFFSNQEIDEFDFWVVYEGLPKIEKIKCPTAHSIFITGEPPSIKQYNPKFLRQFGLVLTFRRDIEHPNIIFTQTALPWHVGRKVIGSTSISFSINYDELQSAVTFHKQKLVSVICSNKQFTETHKKRLEFLANLLKHFGKSIDIFGRGIRDIEDKWDAIAPYKYHIVIENGRYPDYFTEKLSDTFLAGAYPFYYGAPNISSYFSENALTQIDIQETAKALKIIEHDINIGSYENSISEIMEARSLVLERYNLFPMICELISHYKTNLSKTEITLLPEYYFQ